MQEITLSLPCVSRMVSVDVLDSTQDLAQELALQGCEANTLVLAYEQTQGRTREGKAWPAARGGVYFTLVLRPAKMDQVEQTASRAAACAVAQALKDLFDFKTKTTSAGDVNVWNAKTKSWQKIAGVLCQSVLSLDGRLCLLLGVGVHVNNKLPPAAGAASVKKLLGREIDPEWVLQETLENFWQQYAPGQQL